MRLRWIVKGIITMFFSLSLCLIYIFLILFLIEVNISCWSSVTFKSLKTLSLFAGWIFCSLQFLCTPDARWVHRLPSIFYVYCWGILFVYLLFAQPRSVSVGVFLGAENAHQMQICPIRCLPFLFILAAVFSTVLHLFAMCLRLGIISIPTWSKCTCTRTDYSQVLACIWNMYITTPKSNKCKCEL